MTLSDGNPATEGGTGLSDCGFIGRRERALQFTPFEKEIDSLCETSYTNPAAGTQSKI